MGTIRVSSGLDATGHLAEIKAWREPKETNFNDEIGIWEKGSQCDKAMWVSIDNIELNTTLKHITQIQGYQCR